MARIGLRTAAAVCSAVALAIAAPLAAKDKRPPNVVIILADDAGYRDFGFQGSDAIDTPNIDALANEGVVFDAAYATMPFCSPSRAGLLTGRYTQRFGYEFNLTHQPPVGVDPSTMGLDIGQETIGDLFRDAGYRTIAVGKWHVGSLPQYHPNARGFDDFYGFIGGTSPYDPQDIKPGSIQRNGVTQMPERYLTDNFADEAARYIRAHADRPFLLYLAFNAVHTPMDAKQEDLARVAGIADPQRRRLAAMTIALDRAVGTVTRALTELDLTDDTLIVFTNDNGGDRIGLDADNTPLSGTKGTLLEGGIRVPMIIRFPGAWCAGSRRGDPVMLFDVLPTALSAARIEPPSDLDGTPLQRRPSPNRALFWRYDVAAAMREGDMKLLRLPDRAPQLFDLSKDIAEEHDLAAKQPEVVANMLKALFEWEAGLEHPRWHTGTYWTQEDIRRYSPAHVASEMAKSKAQTEDASGDEAQP